MSATGAGPDQPKRRPTQNRFVSVGRLKLRVAVSPGTSDEPPLLLMNGIGARLELLEPFVSELDRKRSVIRFDAPGIGGSPHASRPYRLRGLCRALVGVLDELGHDQVDVLGISWGGAVAQQFAFSERDRCRKLVLVSTGTGSIMVPAHPRILAKMIMPGRYTNPDFLASVAQDLFGGSMRHDSAAAAHAFHAQKSSFNPRGYFMQLGAGLLWTSLGFLPLIKQATLVMSGDDDPIVPPTNARILGALIRNSQVEIFPGGHLALVTEASELAPKVEHFLDQ